MKYVCLLLCMLLSASISIASPFNVPDTGSIQAEQRTVNSRLSFALNHVPDRHAVVWVNRAGQLSGKIVPLRTYRTSYGQLCREYTRLSLLNHQSFGLACRQDDGRWLAAGEKMAVQPTTRVMVAGKDQTRLCPYFSKWHPAIQGVKQPRSVQPYHSEEFLRRHQRAPMPRLKTPTVMPQLVLN
ncbi:MAG: hypothetical protein JXQ81_07700 [Desulfuromonadales bacterium]|nr:hypothetical protein [Desulfuromonadales bacterium]MBN2792371.1 hypothetical protein [Desulfuromonadales bacterium]